MEIEMQVIVDKSAQEEEGKGEEEELLSSLQDFLGAPISSDQILVDQVIDAKQQRRLRKLFDAGDRGRKGYLTQEELINLFGKLSSVMPHSFLTKVTTDAETVTWAQFLNIFAIAKGSQQSIFKAPKMSLPEQLGVYILQSWSKYHAVKKVRFSKEKSHTLNSQESSDYDYEEFEEGDRGDRIVLVNDREHRNLELTKAGAILRAGTIGAFFCFISGLVELLAGKYWGYTGDFTLDFTVPVSHVVWFWTAVIGINIVCSVGEILCLYVDSLRAAALISGYLGLDPWLMGYVNDMDHATSAIVRAAFELPHPSDMILGIRPLRYSNRVNGCLKAFLWKSKRGLSAIMIGMFLKRLIPRTTMKVASPFVSVPIAAVWNCLVAWRIILAIYSIVIGNIAIARVVTKVVEPRYRKLSETAKKLIYCVAGVQIALEQQIHPTLETLLRLLCRYWGNPPRDLPIDDMFYLRNTLRDIPREEQLLILQLHAVAIVSNSSISLTALRYLKETLIACDLNPDEQGLDDLREQLSSKSYIDVEHITDLFRDSVLKDHSRTCWGKVALWLKVCSYNFAY